MDGSNAKDRQMYQMAASVGDMAKQPDRRMRLQVVSEKERKKIVDQGFEARKAGDRRREIETKGVRVSGDKDERKIKPTKAMHPVSPIVGRSRDQLSGEQAPPRPRGERNASTKQQMDRAQERDKDRSETGKEQATSRGESESKTRKRGDKADPDTASRPKTKDESTTTRREVEPKARDRKSNSGQDGTIRPKQKKETNPPRGEEKPDAKEREGITANDKARIDKRTAPNSSRRDEKSNSQNPVRNPRRDPNGKEGITSANERENRQKKESDDLRNKSAKPASDKKTAGDEEDSRLIDEQDRKKK